MGILRIGLIVVLFGMACLVSAQDVLPRLSPIPDPVDDAVVSVVSLNGEWDFRTGGGRQDKILVPGEWEMQGKRVVEGEAGIYSRYVDISREWVGQRIKLRFDGVSSHAVIYVNDSKVGEHEGGFVPFELDITSAVHAGSNALRVEVRALTISDRLACTSQYAVHTVGGILRKVSLFALPSGNVAHQITDVHFDAQYRDAELRINTGLANESRSPVGLSLYYILRDREGRMVMEKKTAVTEVAASGVSSSPASLRVKRPRQWDPEHPYLYRLVTELYDGKKMVERISRKIGFRQVVVKGNQLLVNGMPVKLRGVNRHSIYPLTGRSISAELERKDAVLFREGNCNYIRTSHYPPTEEFLDACDSLGLFVESESALCWIQHGASPIWKKWNYLDQSFLPWMVQANVEKVVAQRHHPSIIIWSLGNESVWSPLWERVNQVVKELDPSRPTTFHDQCWGGYNNAGSKADIAVYHYPGINGGAACDTMARPVLFGEYAHVSCYSRRELVTDPGVREAYGAPLARMYDSMYHHRGCLGGAIWSGIDDIFHMPDGRIIGYGPWGTIDAWRRAKPEYYGMKKAYSPIVITSVRYPADGRDTLVLSIENRYDFTNMGEIKIDCDIDGKASVIKASIRAHGSGDIRVPVVAGARCVRLSFVDPRGFVADSEQIVLRQPAVAAGAHVALSVVEGDAAIAVRQGDVQFMISKLTGVIVSAKQGDRELMNQGPVFAVVPMNSEDGGKPNVAGETYQNNIYPQKDYPLYTLFGDSLAIRQAGDSVKISMNALYHDGSKGKVAYCFYSDATVAVEYAVQYRGADSLPRQYGLLMQLPVRYDQLSWKRKGDFSIYPAEDIGRTEGSAFMHAKHLAGVEEWGVIPKGDWRDDANDLGSNDFRSTKRNIYESLLTDEAGHGIRIMSDGTQSVRTWLQDGRVQLLVADYSNNGSEPFYGSPHSYGRINIGGKQLRGRMVFRLQ